MTSENGSKSIGGWLIGVFAVVVGSMTVAFSIWLFSTVSNSNTEIRIINARLYGIEEKAKAIEQSVKDTKVEVKAVVAEALRVRNQSDEKNK